METVAIIVGAVLVVGAFAVLVPSRHPRSRRGGVLRDAGGGVGGLPVGWVGDGGSHHGLGDCGAGHGGGGDCGGDGGGGGH